MAIIKDFVVSSRINYACIASSQNKFVLLDLSIGVKYYVFCVRVKKYSIVAFIEINSS